MTNRNLKVLFILKRRGYAPSYGLANSCRFIVEALIGAGIAAELVEVTDNNDIDREVTKAMRSEESGYSKGLRDGRELAPNA